MYRPQKKTKQVVPGQVRVIGGEWRGRKLPVPNAEGLRPTPDRIRETLFNWLQFSIAGKTCLDAFTGSGALAVEALSRGAAKAVFVDNSKEALSCIRQNLEKTHLADRAIVIGQDCAGAIHALDAKKMHFDIIFMDPPYQLNAEKEVLTAIADSKIADEDTQIIIEATLDREFSEDELACFDVVRVKEYKTNKHIFLQKSSREA